MSCVPVVATETAGQSRGSRNGWPGSFQWRSQRSTRYPGTAMRRSDSRTKSGTVPRSSAVTRAPAEKTPSTRSPFRVCAASPSGMNAASLPSFGKK